MRALLLLVLLAGRLGAASPAQPLPVTLGARTPQLPVICYHRFGEEDGFDNLKISGKRFAQQLAWLKKAGYESVTLEQAKAFVEGRGAGLPAKPIILSIDDGYKSGWTVAGPLLRRHGFKAVYFLISSQVNAGRNFLTWDDVSALLAEGHQVGSHTVKHSNLAKPGRKESTQDYARRLTMEVTESRRQLEEKLGIPVKSLAYPLGAYNPVVESVAVKAGYDMIFTVTSGSNVPGEDLRRLRRFIIMGHPPLGAFIRKLGEQRLQASLEGLEEGTGFYARELPRDVFIRLPRDSDPQEIPRVEVESGWLKVRRDGAKGAWAVTLEKGMKPGFNILRMEAGQGARLRRDSYQFQVYRNHWDKTFEPFKEIHGDPLQQ